MADAEHDRGRAELDAELARLKALRTRVHDGIHEAVNILTIWTGEMDLATAGMRKVVEGLVQALEEFYTRYPQFRD